MGALTDEDRVPLTLEAEVRSFEEPGCVKAGMRDLIPSTETAGSYAATQVRYHYVILGEGGA